MTNPQTSGSGTRPTTSGGVDNIGAGEKFSPAKGEGETSSPAPRERMSDKREDAAASLSNDAVPLGLREDPRSETL